MFYDGDRKKFLDVGVKATFYTLLILRNVRGSGYGRDGATEEDRGIFIQGAEWQEECRK